MVLKDFVVIGLVAALLFGTGFGFGHRMASEAAHKAELVKLEAATREIESLNKQLFASQEKFDEKVAGVRSDFAKDKALADADHARTVAAVRDGSKRLRVVVTSCDQAPAAAPASAPDGTHGAATAELPPETGVALYQIVDDADATARKLKGLQQWAQAATELCKGETK